MTRKPERHATSKILLAGTARRCQQENGRVVRRRLGPAYQEAAPFRQAAGKTLPNENRAPFRSSVVPTE